MTRGRARSGAGPLVGPAMAAGLLTLAAPARADTLEEALAAAYRSNPTLLAARAQQRGLDESVPIAKADGRPSVQGDAQYIEFLRQAATSFTAPERGVFAGVDLSVPVYSGGAVRNAVRAAQERVEAGRADLRATESAVFSNVVAAYMDVIRAEALVGLSQGQVQVLSINLQATQDRFEIGELTRTDIAQSQSRLALAQGDLRTAESNLIAAREFYIALVGEAPDDLAPPPPLPVLPDTLATAVAVALERNPDLEAARERAQAAGFDIDVAGAGRLPRVSLFTTGDYQNFLGTLGGPVGANVAQTTTAAQAGVRLTVPIFQGGRPAARQRQAQAQAAATLENAIATERDVIRQVRAAFASYRAALALIESSQVAVAAADLSLEGVRAENSIGNRTVLDVLNAEQELVSAQAQLVTARRNAYVAGFTLLAAMGQAEARDLGLDPGTPLYDPIANYDRVEGKWWDWSRDPDPEAQATRTVDIPPADAMIGPVDDGRSGNR